MAVVRKTGLRVECPRPRDRVYTVELRPSRRPTLQARPVPPPGARRVRARRVLAGVPRVLDRQFTARARPAGDHLRRQRAHSRPGWSESSAGERCGSSCHTASSWSILPRRSPVRRRHGGDRVHGFPAVPGAGDGAAGAVVLRRADAGSVHLRPPGRGLRAGGAVPRVRPRARGIGRGPGRRAAWPAIEALDAPLFYLSGPPQMLAALTAQLLSAASPQGDPHRCLGVRLGRFPRRTSSRSSIRRPMSGNTCAARISS